MYRLLIKTENPALVKYYSEIEARGPTADSGIDLVVPEDISESAIDDVRTLRVDHQISCEMIHLSDNSPCGFFLAARSSLSKTPYMLANGIGIIDSGYRGPIVAALRQTFQYNPESFYPRPDFRISKGMKLVQICAPTLEPIEVKVVSSLSETTRGDRGFGSTGRSVDLTETDD